MGKSLQSAARLKELSRIVSSPKPHSHNNPPKQTQPQPQPRSAKAKPVVSVKVECPKSENLVAGEQCRTPLATVVADCAKRWFQDTLKEAKAGDSAMQVLIGQMYYSGYGVPKDPRKGWGSEIIGLLRLSQLASKSQDPQLQDMLGLVKHLEVEIRFGKYAKNSQVTEQATQIHVNWRTKQNLILNFASIE